MHSSSCRVLFRLCETLCVDTDHFAKPRTLGLRVHSRVSNLDFYWKRPSALPFTAGATLRPRKRRGQCTLPGGVIAAPDGLPILSSELPPPLRHVPLCTQPSVLPCRLSVKSRFGPDNEHTAEPREIAVALLTRENAARSGGRQHPGWSASVQSLARSWIIIWADNGPLGCSDRMLGAHWRAARALADAASAVY